MYASHDSTSERMFRLYYRHDKEGWVRGLVLLCKYEYRHDILTHCSLQLAALVSLVVVANW